VYLKMANSDAELGSVSGWIAMIRQGKSEAMEPLVKRYFERLSKFADRRLRSGQNVSDAGEDVANLVIQNVTSAIQDGQYPALTDRNDLWLVLMIAAQRRVIDCKRNESFKEDHHTSIRNLTDLMESMNLDLDEYLGEEDDQQRGLELVDFWEEMIKKLPEEIMRTVASHKLQGLGNREIARKMIMTPKRIDRIVHKIRDRWELFLD
jgi:DNA-directed RNA polymerase specialized sigma24 family protein